MPDPKVYRVHELASLVLRLGTSCRNAWALRAIQGDETDG